MDHSDPASAARPPPAATAGSGGALPDPVSPDHAEEALGDVIDDAVPARGFAMLPMVGLGGSAGCIQALKTFFESAPVDSGAAFVVVVHLAADRESLLAGLIANWTTMPVEQVSLTAKVERDHVYVIPPGKALASADGHLQLTDLPEERGRRVAVDLFFRTLADTHGPHAMAVVLSGADGDGAIGIKRIKERGGLTIAQDPDEAEHPSMPRSAIATGMVDWILPVARMPERLRRYQQIEHHLKLPPEDGPQPARRRKAPADGPEAALAEILAHLHARSGHDFTYYKRATILRRIARRMRVNEVEDLPTYLDFTRSHPGEAGALLQDLLISVTNFFRDTEAFAALAAQLPGLFENRADDEPVRVWVPACATGEEAYSIAMLLAEHVRESDIGHTFQIFATDLDDEAIRVARDGVYPPTIAADVSDARLRRFFVKDIRGYRIKSELREAILFATHDLLRDSPFSRIDLVSCRNLLIYLERDAQQRALDIFHFGLRPSGRLFLGASETAESSERYSIVDKKHRLYAPRPTTRANVPLPLGSTWNARSHVPPRDRVATLGGAPSKAALLPLRPRPPEGEGWRELHLRLLERLAPPSALVTDTYELVHLSEHAGRFLEFIGGEPTTNLLALLHPLLLAETRTALLLAETSSVPVQSGPVALTLAGEALLVSVRVVRAAELGVGFMVVVFDARSQDESGVEGGSSGGARPVLKERDEALEGQVEELKWHLRDLTERRDVAIEELKAGNEELQAMNEELRSATEELETSREELQSINEELTTVNHEMKGKVDELALANADLQNLISATAVNAVFLTRDLRISRFTPSAVQLFKLIDSDVGRPLADLATGLAYAELADDARAVVASLVPREREVQAGARWFLAGVMPYRTSDDRIAGVVVTFAEITSSKLAEEAVRASEERFRTIVSQASAGVCHTDLDGRFTFANPRYGEITGYGAEALIGRSMAEITHPDDRARSAAKFAHMIATGEPFEIEKRYVRHDGGIVWVNNSLSLRRDGEGKALGSIAVSIDITERRRDEEALRHSNELLRVSEERMRAVLDNAVEYAIISMDLDRRILNWNVGAERILGFPEQEALGQSADLIFTPEDRAIDAPALEATTALATGRAADERWHLRKNGSRFWGSGVMTPIRAESGDAVGLLKIFRDTSDERASQQALEAGRAELVAALADKERGRIEAERASRAKDRFLAMLSHELRTPLTPVVMAAHALERATDVPESIRATLDIIRRNVRAEMVLIDDLLDLTRISSGKLEMTFETIDLHDAVRGALEVCEGEIRARRQQLQVDLAAVRHRASGDLHRLRQVVWNLLRNAGKFTPVGGSISVRTSNEEGRFVLTVADTGIGIESVKLVTIFDAFEQGGEDVSRQFGGLGLGLAIAKAMVDAHHGTLRAASAGSGRGTTFTVELPLPTP